MLSIKKSLLSYMPQLHSSTSDMQLSPVVSESDELIRAIEEDIIRHDDNWTLEATPDSDELVQSWDAILDDSDE